MKTHRLTCKIAGALVLFLLIICTSTSYAEEQEPEVIKMHTIAYCQGTTTATGTAVRKGICAVAQDKLGMTALVYANNDGEIGELLGIFECLDTGFGGDADGDGIGSIESGKCIDIYFPTYEECVEWMKLTGGRCFVQYVDAKG
jgi:3D (Asp-Asp-Asp) domain-containing protein